MSHHEPVPQQRARPLVHLLATGFGTGYLPIGPGSWGTFPGMLLCWAMQPLPTWAYLPLAMALGLAAVPIATAGERHLGKKDPGAVVIDEIVAFPITMWLIPLSLGTLAAGFFLNRLMDTLKLWPCHRLQSLPGGWGIVLDDLVAAAQSCLLMHVTLHFWPELRGFWPL
jgi:phosphatidylglycerophosphatase A